MLQYTELTSINQTYLNNLIYWSNNHPDLIRFLSTHCKTIYDKYIERFNSLLSRYIHKNYRVQVSDIQNASQIVLEVDQFMKRLEAEAQSMRIRTENTSHDECNDEVLSDEPLPADNNDANNVTKILEGKAYEETISKVSAWHKATLVDVLENKVKYAFQDQRKTGVTEIQQQLVIYENFLQKHVADRQKKATKAFEG